MANSGDLQRFLSGVGFSEVKLDTVTRKLRGDGALVTRGRGPYAHHVSAEEAAKVIIAYLGTSKAAFAASRLNALADIRSSHSGQHLLEAVTDRLTDESLCHKLSMLRVSRRSDRATFYEVDGSIELFCNDASASPDRVGTEGFMIGDVFRGISLLLSDEGQVRQNGSTTMTRADSQGDVS